VNTGGDYGSAKGAEQSTFIGRLVQHQKLHGSLEKDE